MGGAAYIAIQSLNEHGISEAGFDWVMAIIVISLAVLVVAVWRA